MSIKVSVNLPEATVETLKKIAARQGITMTEVIRNAIANEKFFLEAVDEGSKILIESKDRKDVKQVILH